MGTWCYFLSLYKVHATTFAYNIYIMSTWLQIFRSKYLIKGKIEEILFKARHSISLQWWDDHEWWILHEQSMGKHPLCHQARNVSVLVQLSWRLDILPNVFGHLLGNYLACVIMFHSHRALTDQFLEILWFFIARCRPQRKAVDWHVAMYRTAC